MALSKSSQPLEIFSMRSSAPTKSAPASSASFSFWPFGKDQNPHLLSGPVGKDDRASNHLVRFLGVHSEPDGEVHALIEFGKGGLLSGAFTPSSSSYRFVRSTFSLASKYFFPLFAIGLLSHHLDAHASGGSFDRSNRTFQVHGIQVLEFDLGNLSNLLRRHLSDLIPVGFS